MKWTSEAQIAVLSVRSSSSPGPGTGSGVSRTCQPAVPQHHCAHT